METIPPIAPAGQPERPRAPTTGPRPVAGPIVRRTPSAVPRTHDPDITGLYEHIPVVDGQNSAVLLQINQAGAAIVGWFCAPPLFVPNVASTLSRSRSENDYRIPNGVLVGSWEELSPEGIPVSWMARGFDAMNTFDPDDVLIASLLPDPSAAGVKAGFLRIVTRSPGEVFLEIDLKFDNASSSNDRFLRIKRTARMSRLMLDFLPASFVNALVAETVAWVPSSYVDTLRAKVASTGDVDPPVRALFEAWKHADDKYTKQIKREQIANTLANEAFSARQATPEQKLSVGLRLRAHMETRRLTIGQDTRSYLDWYRAVLGEELDEIGPSPAAPSIVKQRFDDAGISLLGNFCYTISFIKLGKDAMFIAKAGFYAFGATIKKDEIAYDRASNGSLVFVDGKPKYHVVRTVFDTGKTGQKFLGFFGDMGIGLGFSLSVSGGGILGTITILSAQDLRFDDFANANFKIVAARGPSVSVGNFVSFDSSTTRYVEITLPSTNTVLSSNDTTVFAFNPPKVPSLADMKDPAKYIKGWTQAKFDGKIFDLSAGYGYFLYEKGKGPDETKLPDPMKPANQSNLAKRTIEAFFAVDSADINARRPDGVSPRYVFEVALAIERALFDSANARGRAYGYASPEHDAAYNLGLSQARAEAIVQAVKDAFAATLMVSDLQAIGLGEEPAIRSGLHDPESMHLTRAQFTAQFASEVASWPDWRKVLLEIEGLVVAQGNG